MGDLQKEINEKINEILIKQHDVSLNFEDILKNLRLLRNFCARGSDIQFHIASNKTLFQFLKNLLLLKAWNNIEQLETVGWQLVANMTVNNKQSQSLVWESYGNEIVQCLITKSNMKKDVDIILMILYNVMKLASAESLVERRLVLKAVVHVWHKILEQKCSEQFEFLHYIFEEFLVNNGRATVKFYTQLDTNERLSFLDYLYTYIQQDSQNGLVHPFILQYISKEFKKKSDCILRVASMQEVEKIKPQEAYALLRCLAAATGLESYSQIYSTDHSLFLNASSILRCLVAASKAVGNTIFSPMNKLEEVAPTSTIPGDYQLEVSFELKTLLIRCIANLLYNNDTNKRYCLDTQLLPALFECTNMDARNPLMKEWSILAIRNATIGCPEVQQVIANLTQQGTVKNDIISDLNLDMGALRINPCEK